MEREFSQNGLQGCGAGRNWMLLHSNRDAWEAAIEMCSTARKSIAIEQFIFSAEGIGDCLFGILADRARAGVSVRIAVDAFGSRGVLKSTAAQAVVAAGGEIRRFHGVDAFLRNPKTALHRLHRKTVICDGEAMMVGGSCFAPRMRDWRDTMLRAEAPELATEALESFDELWISLGEAGSKPPGGSGRPVEVAAKGWSYVTSYPEGGHRNDFATILLDRIRSARRSVLITTPYLLPDSQMRQALAKAVRNGARTRVLVPARSDHLMVDFMTRWFAYMLKAKGVEIGAYEPGMLHAKLAVIDGDFASVGSFNYGIDSMRMNMEGVAVTADGTAVAELAQQIGRDFAQARLW